MNANSHASPTAHTPHNPNNFQLTPPTNFPYKDRQITAKARLTALLKERILILDGAMGTEIQNYKLTEADYRGERFASITQEVKGNNDLLVLTQPQIIQNIHSGLWHARFGV